MLTTARKPITIAEFEAFLESEAEIDTHYELIAGEIVTVPANPFAAKVTFILIGILYNYLLENDIGHGTSPEAGYIYQGNVFAPDVAFTSYERQKRLENKGFGTVTPDLAVEVISDPKNAQELRALRRKIGIYLAAGTLVWIVDPFAQTIEVYTPGEGVEILGIGDTLKGGDTLPGFTLPLKQLFERA